VRYSRPAYTERKPPTPPADNPFTGILSCRYALWNGQTERWHFFQVDNPEDGKWAGFTFLSEQHGGEWERVRDKERRVMVLSTIMKNPLGAAKDYGFQIGECGQCHTALTNPKSIAAGIGPVCIKKF
jgi:hypothetical protein